MLLLLDTVFPWYTATFEGKACLSVYSINKNWHASKWVGVVETEIVKQMFERAYTLCQHCKSQWPAFTTLTKEVWRHNKLDVVIVNILIVQ